LAALRDGSLHDYVAARDIDYVIDHAWIVDHFLAAQTPTSPIRLERVEGDGALGVRGWAAYRVQRNRDHSGQPIFSRLRP
jgi:hypothetical protein